MIRIDKTKYLISDAGVVVNEKTNKKLKPQNNGRGYLKITLTVSGVQIQRYIHRLVAELYVNNPENKPQVNHKDGDKSNNCSDNLEWVTNSENQIHAHMTGLKQNGNRLWNGKFSATELKKIIRLDRCGLKRYLIAKEMNCSKSTISDILNGKRYRTYILH